MLSITLHARSREPEAVATPIVGIVPYEGCPLAVTPAGFWSAENEWRLRPGRWEITHIATGFTLRSRMYKSQADAMTVLLACEPEFPAWQFCNGAHGDAATDACRYKWRLAVGE